MSNDKQHLNLQACQGLETLTATDSRRNLVAAAQLDALDTLIRAGVGDLQRPRTDRSVIASVERGRGERHG